MPTDHDTCRSPDWARLAPPRLWRDWEDLQNFESTSHFSQASANRQDSVERTGPFHRKTRHPDDDFRPISGSSRTSGLSQEQQHYERRLRPHRWHLKLPTVSAYRSLSLTFVLLLYYCAIFAQSTIMLNSDQPLGEDSRPATRIKYPPFVRVNRCYSCMSAIYEPFFRAENSHLAKFFYEPRNFTAHCDDAAALERYEVGVVPCRAICLTLTQEFTVMGRKTGKRLTMRGCATSLSRYGFYNRTFALFDQYDLCREVLANELFRYDTDSQIIRVCSCLGDRCNGSAGPPARRRWPALAGLALAALSYLVSRPAALLAL